MKLWIQTSGWICPEPFKGFYLTVKGKVLGNTNTLKDDLLKAVTYIQQYVASFKPGFVITLQKSIVR